MFVMYTVDTTTHYDQFRPTGSVMTFPVDRFSSNFTGSGFEQGVKREKWTHNSVPVRDCSARYLPVLFTIILVYSVNNIEFLTSLPQSITLLQITQLPLRPVPLSQPKFLEEPLPQKCCVGKNKGYGNPRSSNGDSNMLVGYTVSHT